MEDIANREFKCIEAVVKDGESVIKLFDTIDEYSAKYFVEEFEWLENISSSIRIRINSAGGSVLHGWSIVDKILSSKVPTTAVVVGVAASMASIVMICANKSEIMDYASVMVHNPFIKYATVDVESKQLETYREQMIRIYSARTGLSRSEVEIIMNGEGDEDETWMTAEIAEQKGFVDKVIPAPAKDREQFLMASVNATEILDIQAKYSQILESKILNINKKNVMLDTIKATLKLNGDASEATINAKVQDLVNRNGELDKSVNALTVSNKQFETELSKAQAKVAEYETQVAQYETQIEAFNAEKAAAVKAENDKIIADAVKDGRIPEDQKESWEDLLEKSPEAAKAAIVALTPVGEKKKLSDKVKPSATTVEVDASTESDEEKKFTLPTIDGAVSAIYERTSGIR